MQPLYEDFKKHDLHLWLHKTHNAHALHQQFPKYPLHTLYRIKNGVQPLYMPDREYLTLKGILEFADYHKREAGRLKFTNLASKYRIGFQRLFSYYRAYKEGL